MTILMVATAGAAAEDPAEIDESANTATRRARNWQLRFGLVATDNSGDTSVSVEPGLVSASIDGGGGGSISLERRVSPLIGVEFGFTSTVSNFDVSAGARAKSAFTATDMLVMTPLTLGANFHFVNDGPIDVYAGPLVAYNRYSELSIRTGVDFPWWPWGGEDWNVATVRWTDSSELTWGARAGLGLFFGKKRKWSAQFALTYLDATYELQGESEPGRASIALDPLMFGFGFGFRF
jgi:outer membrane protein W